MTEISEAYAQALFTLAAEEGVKAEVAQSVKVIKDLVAAYPEYTELLAAPNIPFEERSRVIDEAFGEKLHEFAVSFVKLLCERGHIRDLDECLSEYLKLYEASDGTATAEVVSAAELTEAEKEALKEKLEKKFSKKVELHCTVDESILGGIIVSVDGTVMDGSLKRRLADAHDIIGK